MHLRNFFAASMCLLLICSCYNSWTISVVKAEKIQNFDKRIPFIMAHRGGTRVTPENTLAAFEKALSLGVNIELDIRLTKDNVIVVIHDISVDRTTNGKGIVADMNLSKIKTLDAGSYLSKEYAGESIPTLEQVFVQFSSKAPTNVIMSIDTKVENAKMFERLIDLLEEFQLFDRTFIEVSNAQIASTIQKLDSRVRFAVWAPSESDLKIALKSSYFERIHTTAALAKWTDAAHAAGKTIIPLVHTKRHWQKVKCYNIDGINTDHPFIMKKLNNRRVRPSNRC